MPLNFIRSLLKSLTPLGLDVSVSTGILHHTTHISTSILSVLFPTILQHSLRWPKKWGFPKASGAVTQSVSYTGIQLYNRLLIRWHECERFNYELGTLSTLFLTSDSERLRISCQNQTAHCVYSERRRTLTRQLHIKIYQHMDAVIEVYEKTLCKTIKKNLSLKMYFGYQVF